MDKRFVVSLLILFAGCAAMIDRTSPVNSDPVRSESEPATSVYKSIIEAMYVKDGIKLIVVRDQTVPGNLSDGELKEQLQRAAKELPLLSQETVRDFLRNNSSQHPLINSFKRNVDLKRISESESKAIFQEANGWEEFYKKYPHSQGVLELSKPGFNGDATQALVYVANQGSWKGGAGYYVLLGKENNRWKIEKRHTSWVS